MCQKAFLSIHGIGSSRLKTLRSKDLTDKRGRHSNRPNRIGEEVKQIVSTGRNYNAYHLFRDKLKDGNYFWNVVAQ